MTSVQNSPLMTQTKRQRQGSNRSSTNSKPGKLSQYQELVFSNQKSANKSSSARAKSLRHSDTDSPSNGFLRNSQPPTRAIAETITPLRPAQQSQQSSQKHLASGTRSGLVLSCDNQTSLRGRTGMLQRDDSKSNTSGGYFVPSSK